jgi:hypothetical protein
MQVLFSISFRQFEHEVRLREAQRSVEPKASFSTRRSAVVFAELARLLAIAEELNMDNLKDLNRFIKYAQIQIDRARNDLTFWTKEMKDYKKRKKQLRRKRSDSRTVRV